jgi:hypothetical protein
MTIDGRFCWTTFDVRGLLPGNWSEDIVGVARSHAREKVLMPRSVTSREADPDAELLSMTAGGALVAERLPWLFEMYRGVFRDLAQRLVPEKVACAEDRRYGCVLNVQRGTNMRYECHVDSNPIEGLLYVTDHPPGAGGELVVANSCEASSPSEVDQDAAIIYPISGNLIFFDARQHAHYVRALTSEASVRVVAAMNYYTPSCPESQRPPDLNAHLGID